ncbi:MAG: hypothetical protein HQL72_08450 [Magnetococcales bacterium]|nr:hypothetical protein [Magnetococcales bacterium]
MSDTEKKPDALSNINIVMQSADEMRAQQEQSQETTRKDPAEEWKLNRAAISRFAKDGNWPEVLKLLKILSTKHRNKEVYKALAMRVWVCLKSDAPVTEVVLALFHLFNTLGSKHEIAGPIAALGHLMAKNRTPDHQDRDLALGQAQQMFSLVCENQGIVGEEAFNAWVTANNLEDPNHYIPIVMNCLDIMVGEDWWFEKDQLQQEMEEANRKKQEEEGGHA